MKTMLWDLLLVGAVLCSTMDGVAQTVINSQGFESPSSCTNWGYTGGVVTAETRRTGSNALRVGRSGESNTVTFNTLNVSGLAGLQLSVYHAVRSGSGPGMDVREGAVMQVAINGTWTTIGRVGGLGDHTYSWTNTTGGAGSTTCSPAITYQCPNPLVYTVPAGTNTIAFRVFAVSGGSNCTTFNTLMNGNVGSNYDRTDEGFQIDDVVLSTTTAPLPFIWTGAVDTDWHKCNNWRYGVVPTLTSAVTIDHTASNHCEVYTANAQCASLTIASSTANAWGLTVRSARQLAVTNDVSVTRTGAGGAVGITLGSTGPSTTGTFTCRNLVLTGSAAGNSTAFFRNEVGTNGMVVQGNLTIQSGGQLDLSAGATGGVMQLRGNYTNNDAEGAFSEAGSLVWFGGTATQSITTAGFEEYFGSLRLGKSSGDVTLVSPVRVRGAITFGYIAPGGRIMSSSSALLSMENTASVAGSGGTDGSHVDGPLQKFGNTDLIYPVGEAGLYRPVLLTEIAGSATDAFIVRYRRQSGYTAYGINRDAFLDHLSDCEHWTVDRSVGTPNARVTLSWHDIHSCGVTLPDDLRVAWWDASAMAPLWRDRGNDGATTTAWGGWVPSGEVQNQLGPFTLGSATAENPLPIALLFFHAQPESQAVQCSWVTTSEWNNDHFIVERSADGTDYTAVGQVVAVGNSSSVESYTFLDVAPLRGTSYYRLRQVDVDGTTSVSGVVPVRFDIDRELRAWMDDGQLHVVHGSPSGTPYEVVDAAGRIVAQGLASADRFEVRLSGASSAVYVLLLRDPEETRYVRLAR